ncbi:MAG TPA: alkaline phosphatase family protein [Anaerolineales bacterium]|nr:alkaline phosphatase family protein [Anaerolineales bacterium]
MTPDAELMDEATSRLEEIKELRLKQNTEINSMTRQAMLCMGLIMLCFLTACQPNWEITIEDGSDTQHVINAAQWRDWQIFQDDDSGNQALLMDRVFYQLGYELIENVVLVSADGSEQSYVWSPIAYDTWLMKNGQVKIGDQLLGIDRIQIEPPLSYFQASASIIDIAPTVAVALGIPAPEEAIGTALVDQSYERVMLLFLDGFGFLRVGEAIEQGLSPFIATLYPPIMALTTFPPRTQVSSASVLTGAPPAIHGVHGRNTRKTETQTIFDVAVQQKMTVQAVEGDALSFELRNAQFKLSGDRNGDGKTDDEVLANTLAVLEASQPDLLWVHFHGIDDAGHSYGPGAPEEQTMISFVDQAVEQILEKLEPGTFVIIFADHGMHIEDSDGRQGNHGNLIEEDMLIPIFLIER